MPLPHPIFPFIKNLIENSCQCTAAQSLVLKSNLDALRKEYHQYSNEPAPESSLQNQTNDRRGKILG